MGWRICEIAEATGEKEKTLHSWKARDEWDRADNVERIGGALEARLVQLILKEGEKGAISKRLICCTGSWSGRRGFNVFRGRFKLTSTRTWPSATRAGRRRRSKRD
ncbi:hypothetical protein MZE46_028895 [Pseudomonas sp. A4]|nr:hypothetical protein [Pseudomonas sp. S11A4]